MMIEIKTRLDRFSRLNYAEPDKLILGLYLWQNKLHSDSLSQIAFLWYNSRRNVCINRVEV